MQKTTSVISKSKYKTRRELVFLLLSGLFLGTLGILNILGVSRQIDLSFIIFGIKIPFIVFVGILPYPVTFLCTDFISEIYGKKSANRVVWVGLIVNIWVIFILWFGGILPPEPKLGPDGLPLIDDPARTFFTIRKWTFSTTVASMTAYLTAQFIDVHIFHYIRELTKGKHLWLRNNASTLTSQMVDSVSVVLITYFLSKNAIIINPEKGVFFTLLVIIVSSYLFKMIAALLDTIPFYIGVNFLKKYLGIDGDELHH